jgi:hypothetical protein
MLPVPTLSVFSDSNYFEKKQSIGGIVKQKSQKERPIAKVPTNARNCQNGQKKPSQQMWDTADGRKLTP